MKIIVHYLAFNTNEAFSFPANFLPGESTNEILETIFRECNAMDGSEWIVEETRQRLERGERRGLRSMCAGDCVTLLQDDGTWEVWRCEEVGWKRMGKG